MSRRRVGCYNDKGGSAGTHESPDATLSSPARDFPLILLPYRILEQLFALGRLPRSTASDAAAACSVPVMSNTNRRIPSPEYCPTCRTLAHLYLHHPQPDGGRRRRDEPDWRRSSADGTPLLPLPMAVVRRSTTTLPLIRTLLIFCNMAECV